MEYINTIMQLPSAYLAIVFFIIGAVIGSFIAALIIRWPEDRSIIYGRSSCDQCGHKLQARDLIPLISYSLQRGKCRYCSSIINPLHWRVEFIAASIGALPFLLLPPSEALGWVLWSWLFLPLIILDYKYLWLPNRLIIIAMIAALFIAPLINDVSISDRLIGVIIGYLSLEGIRIAFKKLRNKEAMGGGDPKLLGVLGLYFGWAALPYIILIASCIGLIIALLIKLRHGFLDQDQKFPLGTYMIIAAPIGYALTGIVYSELKLETLAIIGAIKSIMPV